MKSEAKGVSLRERGKSERKARLRDAAEQLIAEKGYDKVTTREVAERAGVGEATLFRYAKSKGELFLLVYGHRVENAVAQLVKAEQSRTVKRAHDGLARIRDIYDALAALYVADPDSARIYIREAFTPGSVLGAAAITQGDRVITLVSAIIKEGQESGTLMRGLDPFIIASNCHAAYVHEIERAQVRGFRADTFRDRVRERHNAQLKPLRLKATV